MPKCWIFVVVRVVVADLCDLMQLGLFAILYSHDLVISGIVSAMQKAAEDSIGTANGCRYHIGKTRPRYYIVY
ncbi:hypothetical protein V1521DRAFT_427384 [Lipomyces starkeyi]